MNDALMAPWAATGRLEPQDARLFAAAVASDPELESDVAAARAEQAAVNAMAETLGRPSARPMLALFAAIDAESGENPSNVTRLTFARSRCMAQFASPSVANARLKKIGHRR